MPTRGRQRFAAHALESFLAQTYPARELVILDDADDPSFPDGVHHPLVRYERTAERLLIPHKRNRINGMTRGELIAHFDSDDWSQPERLATQMDALTACGLAVTGYHDILFYNENDGSTCGYHGHPLWVSGTSMLYWRAWWDSHRFREIYHVGSDNHFARQARDARQLHSVLGGSMIVARIHDHNTSPKVPARYGKAAAALPDGFLQCQPAH